MADSIPSPSPSLPRHHDIIFTLPRTSSNLLTQMLNLPAQPSVHRHVSDGYIFLPTTAYRFGNGIVGTNVNTWTDEQRDGMREAFQSCYHARVFIKEHVNWLVEPVRETRFLFGEQSVADEEQFIVTPTRSRRNETCFPDSILADIAPTMLIRNPILSLPSLLRTSIDLQGKEEELATSHEQWLWEASYHWSRTLYEFYTTSASALPAESLATVDIPGITFPIVVDADDLSNRDLVRRYAKAVGLDEDKVRFEWEATTGQDLEGFSRMEKRMKDTILGSKGIVKGKTAEGLTIDTERVKWEKEFGDVLAARLVRLVELVKGDYEWLWERRLKVE
ncbi:hypothetical protein K504DRAFT_483184 [Pleomassaria siparia CBS 279.74]|uniref:Uncharacterized protein n=1 Tax=Pleomassaria siparia CBS 279.74 TaxID=1314801 RepID=A0A6G1K575_9PLEO|nr:hypothetical protein K504DRAFT_483184 [Pleomassaria siparia CBS 279.74]